MYKAKKEAIIYVNWCRSWQQTNQNRSWRALCVWTAAEPDPAVRPEPAILWYYYTLSNERIPFHKDKTEDDRFFVLTLIAIAEEITARGIGEKETAAHPVGCWSAPGTFWLSSREIHSLLSRPRAC